MKTQNENTLINNYFDKQLSIARIVAFTLAFLFLSLGLAIGVSAQEKPTVSKETKIIVVAQNKRVELSKSDVQYILSKTKNESIRGAINGQSQTIRNCDVAQNIILILNSRK